MNCNSVIELVEVIAVITNRKSVQLAAMDEKVIDDAELPKVVVAILSYVVAIYPFIPYRAMEVAEPPLNVQFKLIEFIADVLIHNPDSKSTPIAPFPFVSVP